MKPATSNAQPSEVPRSARRRVRLNSAQTTVNDAPDSLPSRPRPPQRPKAPPATATLPYTPAQVATGATVYAKYCLSCHGAHLQGVSGPALTGPGFAHANLNVARSTASSRSRSLTAPGSLSKANYAAVMAYILSYDCVKSAGGGTPFPTTVTAQLSTVKLRTRRLHAHR